MAITKAGHEASRENCESEVSAKAWHSLGVPPVVVKALEEQKFEAPTAIQALTLPPAIMGRRDILGAAETGSGKTLAFGIPIIAGILDLKLHASEVATAEINFSEEGSRSKKAKMSNEWVVTDVNQTEEDSASSDGDSNVSMDSDYEIDGDEHPEEVNLDDRGMGCVRVVDNIDFGELQQKSDKPLYALILTPTRELAIQIKNHLCNAAKYTDIRIAVVVGGMAAVKQERILSKGPEIVIATPGRLWELIDQGNPHLNQLTSIKYLAIDETDRMLEKGHFQELHQILERMNVDEETMKERQVFVFSATLTLVHDIPQYLQRKKQKNSRSKIFKLTPGQKLQKVIDLLKIKNPKIVDVTQASGTAGTLTECRIACTIDHKDFYLYYFLKRHQGRTLVFCNSIGCVKRLATLFGILDCNPLPLHASMIQRQRLKNLERFQENDNGLLIATDVAARGLDIPKVEHVIHYQVPRTSEVCALVAGKYTNFIRGEKKEWMILKDSINKFQSYVHRSGRTARAQREGITVLLMEPSEMQYYTTLCKTLGRTQDIPTFPVVDRLLVAVKERVNLAREIDKLELKCRRDNVQKGWLKKAAEEMDLLLDEDQVETTMEDKDSAILRRHLKCKKAQLSKLMSKPLFPKGFSGKYLDGSLELQLQQSNQTAVELMKKSIDENPKARKSRTSSIAPKSHAIKKTKRKWKRTKK